MVNISYADIACSDLRFVLKLTLFCSYNTSATDRFGYILLTTLIFVKTLKHKVAIFILQLKWIKLNLVYDGRGKFGSCSN